MIIYLFGPDSYRRQEKLKEIISEYQKKHSQFSETRFDLEKEEEFGKFENFIRSQSLFDSVRFGIVFNWPSLEKENQKKFKELLEENINAKESVLVVIDGKKPIKDFQFLLEKPVVSQSFDYLEGMELRKFLQKEAQKRNIGLDKESGELLARVFNQNTWGLITELDKLAFLDEKNITKETLKKHLDISFSLNVFETVNFFRNSGNVGYKLQLLEDLLFSTNEPAMVFNILAISPYGTGYFKNQMADYDAAIKSGKLEYEEILLEIALNK